MLSKNFFNRSAVVVAKELLGCFLCTKKGKFRIVETEAYEGIKDKASHASRGKTERNEVMFEGAGTIYIYFTYGMHWMLNIVCGPKGHPGAVLIRGITASPPSVPLPLLVKEKGVIQKPDLSGPARLTKYLEIDKRLNNQKLGKKVGLWMEENTDCPKIRGRAKMVNQQKSIITRTPRIGVAYAGPIWSQKKWRFVLKEI